MKKVKFNFGSKLYLVFFPDEVEIRHHSSYTGDDSLYFCLNGVFHPISDVLSGDFGYQVDDLSAKKKSIYCNDEEFSIAKSVIDILRKADNGLFLSTKILTVSDIVLSVSAYSGGSEDFIV